MIIRNRADLKDGVPGERMLCGCLEEHLREAPRLKRLGDYYAGRHKIDGRTRESGLPNNRLSHPFPRYIAAMASGYLIGEPIRYEIDDLDDAAKASRARTANHTAAGSRPAAGRRSSTENDAKTANRPASAGRAAAFADAAYADNSPDRARAEQSLRVLTDAYRAADVNSVDAELARQASVYGKGVEVVYADAFARPRSAAVSPEDAFVVYDETVAARPLFGMRKLPVLDEQGRAVALQIEVLTDRFLYTYEIKRVHPREFQRPVRVREHFFGRVPMVEYWNGEDETGDFEGVLTLIDAYDALESDRVNDKQQFVDALLVLYGCTLETDALGRSPGRQLREDKALSLPDGGARAEYLCKQLDEADTEVLHEALRGDIHKLSLVPDMSDGQFAGNASGVAMRYKLLGLEQLTRVKERWFREGLARRAEVYCAHLARLGLRAPEPWRVRPVFARALPVNELETARTVSLLRGLVDDKKLREKVGM